MPAIEIGTDQIQIDAEIVAKALKLAPQDLQARMRQGTVTSRFERGEGDDAGRVRLTFFSDTRRARITADTTGMVLTCTGADFSRSSRPTASPKAATPTVSPDRQKLDAMLDDALNDTFPASDPVALSFDHRS
ncbi:DUF6522 family protein [Rhodobacteraceae bacterium LMO-12]|nr:DUF6522 family protein [Rhodobacteraceae bacterium LMO-JJ12]